MPTPRPYIYQTGTVTVTNGSINVTGQGTAFTAIDYADILHVGASSAPILEVVNNTSLNLAFAWAGPTAALTVYAITAGISATDPRRYGWLIATAYTQLEQIPADATAARDAAVLSASQANTHKLAAAASATLSQDWAAKAFNTDVTTPGTRSSLHYSTVSLNHSTAAASSASTATTSAQLSNDWANKAQNSDVTTPGSRSAMHWALTASAQVTSAVASSIGLASGWSSQPFGQDVIGAAPGSRSALHFSTVSQNFSISAAASATLAADWASKGINLDIAGVGTRSAYHWSNASLGYANSSAASAVTATSKAAEAASYAALLENPDFGFITDIASDFQDFGTITI